MAKKKRFAYEYPRPAVTADIVVVTREARPHVLLIRRGREPYAGCWALPGGFIDMDETLEQTARRELREETGLHDVELVQLHAFGDPQRDPRGRTISVAYLARVERDRVQPCAADDAAEAGWHPLDAPPELAFDHARVLEYARAYLTLWGGAHESPQTRMPSVPAEPRA